MKRSKLETYYVETFGERDEADESARPPRRAARPEPRQRGSFGRRLVVRLGLIFAPMAILGIAGAMTDCGARPASSVLPDIVRGTICARHSLMGQSASLESTFRTLSDHLR